MSIENSAGNTNRPAFGLCDRYVWRCAHKMIEGLEAHFTKDLLMLPLVAPIPLNWRDFLSEPEIAVMADPDMWGDPRVVEIVDGKMIASDEFADPVLADAFAIVDGYIWSDWATDFPEGFERAGSAPLAPWRHRPGYEKLGILPRTLNGNQDSLRPSAAAAERELLGQV